MAEARSEEEEENMMRDAREQVVRRQPNNSGGRSDRRKPEHRHSQGPLSSLRAAIKRTSARPTSLSESPRDRERSRDRDRRRPEITILSAEPLASTSWFPGASGGLPPPPPPAAQIWGPTIPPSIQPPPSYEEVIREKTQEQVLLPSSSSSAAAARPASTITISTQTDPGSDSSDSQVKRPLRPSRPPHPYPTKASPADDTSATHKPALTCPDSSNTHLLSQRSDHLAELPAPLTSNAGAQTVPWGQSLPAEDLPAAPDVPLQRPRPRPRSKVDLQPSSREVKVQTLVKLREDGLATIAARVASDGAKQDVSQGKYLTELLEAFSADDWGFPDRHSDSSEHSQSDSEEGEEEEDMATLKARIQAFEQQPVDGSHCGDGNSADFVSKRPEPRPRPRLQGQPSKSVPPAVAPKPKNLLNAPKPSNKMFWEDGAAAAAESSHSADLKTAETPGADEPPPSCPPKDRPALVTPKPATGPLLPSQSVPIPAPRPTPPKHATPVTETTSLTPIPPPRPVVSPRASLGSGNLEKSPAAGHIIPALPPRPSNGTVAETRNEETQDPAHQTVKPGSGRPSLPNKPTAVTTTRRASAPNLTPKPTRVSTDPNSGAAKPPGPVPRQRPPSPALRKASDSQTKPEPTIGSNPSDPPLPSRPASIKLLPLRPPPIKSNPGRPPPPSVSSSLTNLSTTTPAKTTPAPCVSSPNPPPSLQTTSSVSTNPIPPKTSKKGPPLPPRPKPGHPLYNSYSKQEVLIVLDDPSPSEDVSGDGRSQTTITPLINLPQCLLDLDVQQKPVADEVSQSKAALEGLNLLDSQSILPESPAEQKEKSEPPPLSGPRCVALFDYEGEEDDELTFSQGDVIALQELVGQEWGRGQIHGRVGIFPLNFAQVVEPLPPSAPTTGEAVIASQEPKSQEWDLALFDFPGQTAEDLSFHKGAIIQVTEHIDAEWRRGRVEGREGLYPAAFTQPHQAQPVPVQHSAGKAVARFDFTAESGDELTLKVGDIITEVESLDEEWIAGVADGKRGIVPKSYISVL
ncbi:SH3 domain-containing protein 19-like isoform X3 [Takifugu flavidus]|uniref:SH3 domain-containing protein 19-like isoform X3 n=1 Tax=Takifugu flavidus TaxID=433684 RepID=UPI002544B99B|nr:SH3 domain-containing protein 19-like isoform X3 [Takifugu flavidus]